MTRAGVVLLVVVGLIGIELQVALAAEPVVEELTVVNNADGTATGHFVLNSVPHGSSSSLSLGTSVTALDVLPTVLIEYSRVPQAAAPPTSGLPARQAREAFRIAPSLLKDSELSERLSRLVGQQIAVTYSDTTKAVTKTGTLKDLKPPATAGDNTITITVGVGAAAKDEVIARDRIISITSPSLVDDNKLDIITTEPIKRLHYRRSVPRWSMSYHAEVSATANSLRATATIPNPSAHGLKSAKVTLLQGDFKYKFTDIDLAADKTGSFAFRYDNQFNLDVDVHVAPAYVFNTETAKSGTSPQEVIELVNDNKKGVGLVGGSIAVYRDGIFVGTRTLADLPYYDQFSEAIRPLGESFHLHPSQQLIELKAIPQITVKVDVIPCLPNRLRATTLIGQQAHAIEITNSTPNAVHLVVLFPRKPAPTTRAKSFLVPPALSGCQRAQGGQNSPR